ncbi:MAG: hypothetical protein JWR80_10064 [Bradyrhizobium sp.]|nr:hypothetical protein [Bradyrhizobium sp.]
MTCAIKESPNKNSPGLDVEFVVRELFDLFNTAEGGKIRLESSVGSRFHARVVNAAQHLGVS